jgi:hypothetical protein
MGQVDERLPIGTRVEMEGVPGCRGTIIGAKYGPLGIMVVVLPDGTRPGPMLGYPVYRSDVRVLNTLEVLAEHLQHEI